MSDQPNYCAYCGTRFADGPWPRTCEVCERTTWRNPIPVAVIVLPVDAGVLLIRRAIEPKKGQLALPGGFVTLGETWQEAGAREVREESGVVVDPKGIREIAVRSAGNSLLIFGVAPAQRGDRMPTFSNDGETSERLITEEFVELAFPFHTEILRGWFDRKWRV